MKAIDALMKELIDPIAEVGSPEKLIGKSYESWTPDDLARLTRVYGTVEPNPLSNLIFNKTYDRVRDMEREELKL